MTSHYRYLGDRCEMVIYSRDRNNSVIATLSGIDLDTSHILGRVLNKIHEDGVARGRHEAIAAANAAFDQMLIR